MTWKIGQRDSSPSNGHQGDLPYFPVPEPAHLPPYSDTSYSCPSVCSPDYPPAGRSCPHACICPWTPGWLAIMLWMWTATAAGSDAAGTPAMEGKNRILKSKLQKLLQHQLSYGILTQKSDINGLAQDCSNQSSKLAGSPKSEASEIMLRTSETILALVRSD